MTLTTGQSVGRYRVLSVIGGGAMGTVYRVQNVDVGTLFALKVLLFHAPALAERLRREGKAQGKLQHPNVLRVVDLVELPSGPGLVLDLANGPALDALLTEGPRLTFAQADFLVRGIARGVAAAHAIGIVHRDLKPANVLLHLEVDRITPKVSDFGLAKVSDDPTAPRTRTGATLGTPAYMSAEQVRDARVVTAASDVYALGVIAYELLAGEVPFRGADLFETFARICTGERPVVRERIPGLPPHVERVIQASLSLDPAVRPPDGAAFLAAWCESSIGERASGDEQLVEWVAQWIVNQPAQIVEPAPGTFGAASTLPDSVESVPAQVETPPPAVRSRSGIRGKLAAGVIAAGVGLLSVTTLAGAGVAAGWAYYREPPAELAPVLPPLVGKPAAPVVVPPAPSEEPVPVPEVRPSRPRREPAPGPVEAPLAPLDPLPATIVELSDPSLCADLARLETPAAAGELSQQELGCLDERIARSTDQVDRDFTSRLLIRNAQVEVLAGGACGEFDLRMTWHFDQISRADATLLYGWTEHLVARHRPERDEELLAYAERTLENRSQLGEGSAFVDKVTRLHQIRARVASERWVAAQDAYLENGRTVELETVEIAERTRAKTTAREWLEFATSAGEETREARYLCATAAGVDCVVK